MRLYSKSWKSLKEEFTMDLLAPPPAALATRNVQSLHVQIRRKRKVKRQGTQMITNACIYTVYMHYAYAQIIQISFPLNFWQKSPYPKLFWHLHPHAPQPGLLVGSYSLAFLNSITVQCGTPTKTGRNPKKNQELRQIFLDSRFLFKSWLVSWEIQSYKNHISSHLVTSETCQPPNVQQHKLPVVGRFNPIWKIRSSNWFKLDHLLKVGENEKCSKITTYCWFT